MTRYQATPRNANWHVEPRHSRLRDVLYGLAWLALLLLAGVNDVRW